MNKLFTLTLLLLGTTCKISAMGFSFSPKTLGLGKDDYDFMMFKNMECNGEVYEPIMVDNDQYRKWVLSLVTSHDEVTSKNYFPIAHFDVKNKKLAPSGSVDVLYKKKNAVLEGLTAIDPEKLK